MGVVLLHAGIHKTGTKTIQSFLNENRPLLARAGVYVPESGRSLLGDGIATPGHHLFPRELTENQTVELERLRDELASANPEYVVISAEDFSTHHDDPQFLRPLLDRLEDLGYKTTIVVYVREQAGFMESGYSERLRATPTTAPVTFFREVLSGRYVELAFARMARNYVQVVDERIVMRPFDIQADQKTLLQDFLQVMSFVGMPISQLPFRTSFPRANERILLGHAIGKMYDAARARKSETLAPVEMLTSMGVDPTNEVFRAPLALYSREEHVAVLEYFAAENTSVETAGGFVIPHARVSDIEPPDRVMWQMRRQQRQIIEALMGAWFSSG